MFSNFKRDYYTLCDVPNSGDELNGGHIMCTIAEITNFVHPSLRSHELFVPLN